MSTIEFFDPSVNPIESDNDQLNLLFLAETNQETALADNSDTSVAETSAEALPEVELVEETNEVVQDESTEEKSASEEVETFSSKIDENTGFVSAIRYDNGPRAGQEYQFNRDAKGNVTEMTISVSGQGGEEDLAIKLSKGEDGWLVEPPEARDKIPLFESLRFKDGGDSDDTESKTNLLEGDITALEDGTISYDRGDGIKEIVRPDGIRDLYDMNEYSRIREIDGESTKLYWDGYEWRAGEKDPDNPSAVIFSPAEDGKPTRMVRDGESDQFRVEFADGLTYDADWKNQKIARQGGNLPDVTLYPTSHVDGDGDPYWMVGEEKEGPDGSIKIEFKPSNDNERARMRGGELPVEAVIASGSDQVLVKYENGAEVSANSQGEVSEIEHPNGQRVSITRDISGRIIRVENLGGRTYERQGSHSTESEGDAAGDEDQMITRWNVIENGEEVGSFDGEVQVGLNGSVNLENPEGDGVDLDSSGRIVTSIDGEAMHAVDAQGQIWQKLASADDGSEADQWKVTSNGEETLFNGKLKLLDNGVVAIENALGELESINRDGSEWMPEGDGLPFPPRQPGYELGGSQFFRDVLGINPEGDRYQNGLTGLDREKAILAQIEAGNIPDFLRQPKTVVLQDGNGNTAELSVMPDYLAIGTNEDWVRVPVTPVLAQAIADRYGMELPTEKIADAIYDQADVRVTAEGMVSTSRDQDYMVGNGFYFTHNELIEESLGSTADGDLVAGHKKDIILSEYAENNPTRLDYYGFFRANGTAIQNSGGGAHDNVYVDYSHGARFVADTVIVNGQPMSYGEVLSDPQLAGLLSGDGTINVNNIYLRPVRDEYRQLFSTEDAPLTS